MAKADHSRKRLEDVRGFIGELYGHGLHAKRVETPAGATLGVMAGASLAETATIRMIQAFEAANPGIKIVRTKVAFGANFEKVTTAVAAGSPPDSSPIWGGFLPQFASSGALLDLSKYGLADLKDTVYPTGWQYVNWNKGVWGAPFAIDPRFIAYNAGVWREAGVSAPPATLDGIYDMAKALTKRAGAAVDRYGIGFASSTDLLTSYVNLIYAYGGRIFNEDETEVAFNNQQGFAAGTLFHRLVADGYATAGVAMDGLRRALLSGRVGMIIDGAWILYAQSQYPEKVVIDVAPIPPAKAGQASVNVVSVGGYVVFAQCKHPSEAAKFVRFMASPQAQQYRVQLLKMGVSPDVVGADPKQTLDDAARQANRSLRRARGPARMRRRSGALGRPKLVLGVVFLGIPLAWLGIFVIVPLVLVLCLSLTSSDIIRAPHWIGLGNFRDLLDDPLFFTVLRNTLVYTAATVPLGTVLSLGLAMLVNRRLASAVWFRTIFDALVMAPIVAVTLVWVQFYDPTIGLFNYLLGLAGVGPNRWLTSNAEHHADEPLEGARAEHGVCAAAAIDPVGDQLRRRQVAGHRSCCLRTA